MQITIDVPPALEAALKAALEIAKLTPEEFGQRALGDMISSYIQVPAAEGDARLKELLIAMLEERLKLARG